MTFREPLRVAASTPTTPPPSGGDWIPVATDGRWWWDGTRWESTVQSPWPTPQPVPVTALARHSRPRSAVRPVAMLIALPLRIAWFLLRPVAGMVVGLISVIAFLALVAVLVAHAVH